MAGEKHFRIRILKFHIVDGQAVFSLLKKKMEKMLKDQLLQ